MSYPEYVEVEGKRYKINSDFRVAIECNRIAEDDSIGNFERAMAIIYKLFGDEGLNDTEHYDKLLELAQKFLSCGKEVNSSEEKPDMDYYEDMDYIEASFMSDYHIDLTNENMHWWKFYKLINGLSNSELGNCCILNRVRNLRNYDPSEIKDSKEKQKIIKAKKSVELKKYQKKPTKEQEKSIEQIIKDLGLQKGV